MRHRGLQTIIGWICAAAYFCTGTLTGSPALVLCVGSGGHMALELTDLSACGGCPDDAGSTAENRAKASSAPDCGCVDILLIGSASTDQPRLVRSSSTAVAPPAAPIALLDVTPRVIPVARIALPADSPPRSPPVWRTLVLQI